MFSAIIIPLAVLDINNCDIDIYINSPGGSVTSGLAIMDTMNYIKSDVCTIAVGMAASMGAVLLACGEKGKTRNTLYSIDDNFFAFYFAFIFKHQNMLSGLISPKLYYEREFTKEKLNAYVGLRFESICKSYLINLFYNGEMPFYAENIGRWWGNNPILKRQEEIDILAIDDDNAIICECKYTDNISNLTILFAIL